MPARMTRSGWTSRSADERVRVRVRDDGPGFRAPEAKPPREGDKGWGLFLVEQLADEWGVDSPGDGVWFVIDRSTREAPAFGG